jgi:hypothetical protein
MGQAPRLGPFFQAVRQAGENNSSPSRQRTHVFIEREPYILLIDLSDDYFRLKGFTLSIKGDG